MARIGMRSIKTAVIKTTIEFTIGQGRTVRVAAARKFSVACRRNARRSGVHVARYCVKQIAPNAQLFAHAATISNSSTKIAARLELIMANETRANERTN